MGNSELYTDSKPNLAPSILPAPVSMRRMGQRRITRRCGPRTPKPGQVRKISPSAPGAAAALTAIRKRVAARGISEPPVWRKAPIRELVVGERCWYILTDTWPNQALEHGTVVGYDDFNRRYHVRASRTQELLKVHESRVFVYEYTAKRELALLQAECKRAFEAVSLTASAPQSDMRRINMIAREVQATACH